MGNKKRKIKVPNQKECSRCHVVKKAKEFFANPYVKTGLQSSCKECAAKYQAARQYKNALDEGRVFVPKTRKYSYDDADIITAAADIVDKPKSQIRYKLNNLQTDKGFDQCFLSACLFMFTLVRQPIDKSSKYCVDLHANGAIRVYCHLYGELVPDTERKYYAEADSPLVYTFSFRRSEIYGRIAHGGEHILLLIAEEKLSAYLAQI